MIVKTWVPGTDNELDDLFDKLREQQYRDRSHRLWENYSSDFLKYSIALTICFDKDNNPEMCSSIASRDCWPTNAYRILNRTWKISNKKQIMPEISQAMGLTTANQIKWLNNNTTNHLYFISRQTNNWMTWVVNNFARQFNLEFIISETKYLTCPNECDDTCWQHIIYNGNYDILKNWKSK